MADDNDHLKSFLLLAKTTKGAACAALITQVLEHPSIFTFGELLDMANVQQVRHHSWGRGKPARCHATAHDRCGPNPAACVRSLRGLPP